jgi:hypothetical protein
METNQDIPFENSETQESESNPTLALVSSHILQHYTPCHDPTSEKAENYSTKDLHAMLLPSFPFESFTGELLFSILVNAGFKMYPIGSKLDWCLSKRFTKL